MMLHRLIILATCMGMLSACGGGSSKHGGDSVANASSSAGVDAGVIFGEALNTSWGEFSAFEWFVPDSQGIFYRDGQSQNFVQWKILQTNTEHKNVVEVEYTQLENRWAQFEVKKDLPQDLSAYATGTLSFDINVLAWGELYDSLKKSGQFEVRVECGWPCSSHGAIFEVKDLNTWAHIEIPVASMIAEGLDITAVNGALMFMPDRARQKGLRFQLDNIQWKKGSSPIAKKTTVYEQHFNEQGTGGWSEVVNDGYSPLYLSTMDLGLGIYFDADNLYLGGWALGVNLDKAINVQNKTVSLQVYADQMLAGASLLLLATDGSGHEATTPAIALDSLTVAAWNSISFEVDGGIADAGFNPKDVQKLGLRFTEGGLLQGSVLLKIDEIVIAE